MSSSSTQRAPNGHHHEPFSSIVCFFAGSLPAAQHTDVIAAPPGKVKLPTRPCAHATGRTRTVSFPSRGFVNCKPKVVASGFRYRVRSTVAMPEELPLALPGR